MGENILIDIGASQIRADYDGFSTLSKLHRNISDHNGSKIIIECKDLYWFDAQLGASLQTIVKHAKLLNNSVQLHNLKKDVRQILQKNETLAKHAPDVFGTTIPITKFSSEDEIRFSTYSRENLRRREMPRMSRSLEAKFFEGIDELFANSCLWSETPIPIFAGGQYFPYHKRLAFIISDGGQGMQGSLSRAGKQFRAPEDAIDWAMQPNNSARQGDIPGGLGLGIIKNFIKLNGGRILVCSQDGYWEQGNGNVTKKRLPSAFPGTVVSLEINTADTNAYEVASKVDPNDIW